MYTKTGDFTSSICIREWDHDVSQSEQRKELWDFRTWKLWSRQGSNSNEIEPNELKTIVKW